MFRDDTAHQRFEWTESGLTAFADYRERDGFRTLPHVEAPIPLRGTGAAGRLMQAISDHARANGIRLRPTCPYAVAWFQRHPDQQDLLA